MDINYKEVGKRMAKRRKELGMKQYEVCELINVNYKYISNLETGRSVPSLEVIMNICEALQTTPDYLLLGTLSGENGVSDKSLTERISRLSPKDKRLMLGMIELLENEQ